MPLVVTNWKKFDFSGKLIESSDLSVKSDSLRSSKFFYGTVRFGNDHIAAILGYGDLQWGNILITRVYFFEGLGYNMFLLYFIHKNDHEDIGKLGAKGDIGFFIGYFATFCAYRVYNQMTKKIIETMNVTFDELSVMAFEQCSSKPGL
ncbi:hypothetical protein Tco_1220533 [Tanacetum coccineum]